VNICAKGSLSPNICWNSSNGSMCWWKPPGGPRELLRWKPPPDGRGSGVLLSVPYRSYAARFCGSASVSYASAITLNMASAASRLLGFLSCNSHHPFSSVTLLLTLAVDLDLVVNYIHGRGHSLNSARELRRSYTLR
jgi:hypothetical protein